MGAERVQIDYFLQLHGQIGNAGHQLLCNILLESDAFCWVHSSSSGTILALQGLACGMAGFIDCLSQGCEQRVLGQVRYLIALLVVYIRHVLQFE